jgi:hypothetical protein
VGGVNGQKRLHAVFDGPQADCMGISIQCIRSTSANTCTGVPGVSIVRKKFGPLVNLADIVQLQIAGTLCVLTFSLLMVAAK